MKEISVFIQTVNLPQPNACDISLSEINGAGRDKREAISEMVEAYTTWKAKLEVFAN